jgi:hypothetical protein
MPGLLADVKANAASMGPLMGRLYRGEINIGNVPPNVAKLYTEMKSMYALQPAVHGFRNAEFVKDMETAIGTLERNPDAFIAGMQGLVPTLNAVAKEGVTAHHRIIEGTQPAGGNGSGAGAGKLTLDEAKQYLQKAGGDKSKARQMAKADGRDF